MKKCNYCNAELEDNAVKCEYCGMDIPAEAAAEAAPAEEIQPAEQQPQTIADIKPIIQETPVVRKRRKNPWWAKTLCTLLAICLFFTLLTGVSFTLVRQASSGGLIKAVVKEINVFDIPINAEGGTVADMMADTINGMLGASSNTQPEESQAEETPVAQSTRSGVVPCSAGGLDDPDLDDIEDVMDEIGDAFEGTGGINLGDLGFDLGAFSNMEGLQGILGDVEFDGNLTGEQLKELAVELGLTDILTEIASEIGGALTGKTINITSAQILGSVKQNKGAIEEKLGITLTDEHFAKVEQALDKELVNVNKQLNEQASKLSESPVVKTTMNTVSFVVGPVIPITAYVICGVIALFMLLLLRRKESTFIFTGIPTLLVGLTLLTVFLCSDIVSDFAISYISTLGESAAAYSALVQTVVKTVLNPMLTASLITMGAGVVFIVLYVVLKIAIGKSKKYAK